MDQVVQPREYQVRVHSLLPPVGIFRDVAATLCMFIMTQVSSPGKNTSVLSSSVSGLWPKWPCGHVLFSRLPACAISAGRHLQLTSRALGGIGCNWLHVRWEASGVTLGKQLGGIWHLLQLYLIKKFPKFNSYRLSTSVDQLRSEGRMITSDFVKKTSYIIFKNKIKCRKKIILCTYKTK